MSEEKEEKFDLLVYSDDEEIHADSGILTALGQYDVVVKAMKGLGTLIVKGDKEELEKIEAEGLPAPAQIERDGKVSTC
jgi:hypothetical protein